MFLACPQSGHDSIPFPNVRLLQPQFSQILAQLHGLRANNPSLTDFGNGSDLLTQSLSFLQTLLPGRRAFLAKRTRHLQARKALQLLAPGQSTQGRWSAPKAYKVHLAMPLTHTGLCIICILILIIRMYYPNRPLHFQLPLLGHLCRCPRQDCGKQGFLKWHLCELLRALRAFQDLASRNRRCSVKPLHSMVMHGHARFVFLFSWLTRPTVAGVMSQVSGTSLSSNSCWRQMPELEPASRCSILICPCEGH